MRTFPYVVRAARGVLPRESPRSHNPSLCTRPASASLRLSTWQRFHALHCLSVLHARRCALRVCAPSLACCLVVAWGDCARVGACVFGKSDAARWNANSRHRSEAAAKARRRAATARGRSTARQLLLRCSTSCIHAVVCGWSGPRTRTAFVRTIKAKARTVTHEESCSLMSFEDSAVLGASRPSRLRRSLREPGRTCARRFEVSANSDHP